MDQFKEREWIKKFISQILMLGCSKMEPNTTNSVRYTNKRLALMMNCYAKYGDQKDIQN